LLPTQALLVLVWAAFGGGRSWVRWPVAFLLALLLWGIAGMIDEIVRELGRGTITLYELSFVLSVLTQFATTFIGILWLRVRGFSIQRTAPARASPPQWQFNLKQLLIWTTVFCLLLGLCQMPIIYISQGEDSDWNLLADTTGRGLIVHINTEDYPIFGIAYAPLCDVFLPLTLFAGLRFLLNQAGLLHSLVAFVGCVGVLVGVAGLSWSSDDLSAWPRVLEEGLFWLPGVETQVAVIVATMLMLRFAGYRFVRRESNEPALERPLRPETDAPGSTLPSADAVR
jgi:hypothetical protein